MQKLRDQSLAATGPPNHLPAGEGTRTHSHQKYHRSVNTGFHVSTGLLRKTQISELLLLLEPQCSDSVQSQHWGTRLMDKYSCHNISRHTGGEIFFKLFCKEDAISQSMEAKEGSKEREPLPSTPPMIGISILRRPTCQSLLGRCLVGQSRPEPG